MERYSVTAPRAMIVTPVLDDWDAFQRLVAELARLGGGARRFHLLVVDDGSNVPFDLRQVTLPPDGAVGAVTLVRLALNLGHQRAIAVGLTEAALRDDIDAVVVMDGDGEDRPEDVPALMAAHRAAPDAVIFAQRARRSESALFKAGVLAYRVLFRVLARQTVEFGNFALVPIAAVRRLSHMPDLWNNLPATVLRSRIPYRLVPTERGRRYAGRSKMNWNGLVIHGLSAMSVYSDVIFVRLLMAAAAVGAVALLGILVAVVIRFATDLATPGWASTVVGVFMILLVQMLAATVIASLALLGARNRRPFVPKTDCAQFIASRETVVTPAA